MGFILTFCVPGFDMVTDYAWETQNKGKLWKDIKHKYEDKEE